MPGLLGICANSDGGRVRPRFLAMLGAMERGGRLVSETRVDASEKWAVGRVHLGVFHPKPQLSCDRSIQVLFHGDLHNEPEVRATLHRLGEPQSKDTTSVIEALYRRRGRDFAKELRGDFCAAVLDDENKQLLLVSDRLGSYPLYWFKTPEYFVFSSELRPAVRAHPRPQLNLRAVSDLIKFEFPLGAKTLAAGVDLLPASSVLTYSWTNDTTRIERYASPLAPLNGTEPDRDRYNGYLDNVERAFANAMNRAIKGSHRYALSLSGGLDTRVILSALDRLHVQLSTFTLGGIGCADEVIASQLSRMAGTSHRFVPLDGEYLDDLLPTMRRMVSLTDGMYVSHGFTEVLALRAFEESDCSMLLRGHCGELAKASTAWPFHTDARMYAIGSSEEFVDYVMSRVDHVTRGDSAREVFSESSIEALAGSCARRSLEEAVDGVRLAAPDLCSYLYLHEFHRRTTIASLEIFRSALETRLPLADVEFIEAVFQGPSRWRDGTTIHQSLIARNNPAYLRVRNPNTGAPAGAGPLKEAVLDKLNTVLRRLNVYGYRHYHSFDGWMRRALIETTERVLLAPDTLSRGIFSEAVIRDRIAAARAGVRDHDDLLQALVTVELWQQENL